MKAIINGKRFDTAKATLIGEYWHGEFSTDFNHYTEALYVTPRSKTYFLAGSGNARTKYARNTGDGSYGAGARITPMTPESARKWAAQHLTSEEYELAFHTAEA